MNAEFNAAVTDLQDAAMLDAIVQAAIAYVTAQGYVARHGEIERTEVQLPLPGAQPICTITFADWRYVRVSPTEGSTDAYVMQRYMHVEPNIRRKKRSKP